jgi:hypothetical protein
VIFIIRYIDLKSSGMMKKFGFIIVLLVVSSGLLYAQSRRIINIPNISGYQTLKCDLHMHTVFSDGTVWPTVRIEEAWNEGSYRISSAFD